MIEKVIMMVHELEAEISSKVLSRQLFSEMTEPLPDELVQALMMPLLV